MKWSGYIPPRFQSNFNEPNPCIGYTETIPHHPYNGGVKPGTVWFHPTGSHYRKRNLDGKRESIYTKMLWQNKLKLFKYWTYSTYIIYTFLLGLRRKMYSSFLMRKA